MHIIAVLLVRLLNLLTWLIIIQCLMSWFPGARYSKPYEILSMITEPLVGPIRELLFRYIDIPIDFSPIIAFFIISMVQRLMVQILFFRQQVQVPHIFRTAPGNLQRQIQMEMQLTERLY